MITAKSVTRKLFRLIRFAVFFFFFSTVLVTIIYRFVRPPVTPLQLIRVAEQIAEGEKVKMNRDWVKLRDISPHMVQAVVAAEDNNFMKHHGFDLEAIKKARELNKKRKNKLGASTISQQTAKNVFLWPDRTWLRKGLEVYFTGLIEIFWGKRRIMEVYLNVIEMGDGIYGVEKAAGKYYRKPASDLNRAEAAMIAAVLPNPRRWSPAAPTAYIQRKQQRIMRVMNQLEQVKF
ncbi:monofunctional biosynthetic peptidoglycan transglycosylase [Lentimicrobium sp.]|uniref:monofunctional biosynthetic peptidoglycan transglycosylase n=2 Tax=Lentimicrobium sp. TaxID=2034841 RepID=UPI002CEF3588|nr:monofunctional biosynthetic peptidoglycan transglycosylase [Lentimicrobium sp.]HOP13191.1 monofunctional biosynthetic peptidoglycan transglycosylase [Lentimicrobium sp.]HPF63561.1 monofunctional biosynthetic peptidoglycan transglycosylase [Lentimicrobium sp.]HPJ63414.1 monofunctional biosynthetic peptidoglycan transglycosylase [Lentimicrobium sp.]